MGLTLITGASGFIGSHLVADMRARGLSVRPVSRNESTGVVKINSYNAETDWRPYLHNVSTVVHLAARVHVMRETETDPLAAFRLSNVDATIALATQAAKAGVKRFIFMSTIKVNGEETEPGTPFTNFDRPNPQEPYAVSKAEAEIELWKIAHQTGLEITVIRPPLVYGPGVAGNFGSLLKYVRANLPSVFAKINNKRSFIYVRNLTDFVIKAIDHPLAANRHFLVSDGQPLSTHRLILELTQAAGGTVRSVPLPISMLRLAAQLTHRTNVIDRLLSSLEVDDRATREILRWNPPYDLQEAVKHVLSH